RYIPVFASEITLWEDTLEKNPDCPAAMQNLGLAYLLEGRLSDAEQVLTSAKEYDFDRYQSFNSLGLVFARQNRDEDALTAFETSAFLNPGNEQAWLNLGNILRRSSTSVPAPNADPKDSSRASHVEGYSKQRYYYLRSMLANPNYAAAFALGTLALENGNAFAGIFWFSEATELRPHDLDAKFNLALSLQLAQRREAALAICEAILEQAPNDGPTIALLQQLRDTETQ
ncbi:MAG: tetratricopeptide repeat protein, partial [Planctomycetota bacterium]